MDRLAYRSPDQKSYCGPLAVTILTGFSYKAACGLINSARGVKSNTPISVIDVSEITKLLTKLGFNFIIRKPRKSKGNVPTIARWETLRSQKERTAPILCTGSRHVYVVEGDRIWDTYTKSSGDYLCEYPKRRFRVEEYYVLTSGPYIQHSLADKIKSAPDTTRHCVLSIN